MTAHSIFTRSRIIFKKWNPTEIHLVTNEIGYFDVKSSKRNHEIYNPCMSKEITEYTILCKTFRCSLGRKESKVTFKSQPGPPSRCAACIIRFHSSGMEIQKSTTTVSWY
ncbi:hypothetical protein TNCT_69871 [Trichonephila clavata]|uniref:Uncharacterized protein n=1 Tax=Trichonephila clavata TaxID=2740835 RepID=A0A8X6KY83_TRICU|nr:hypothetical protein TNCT_69871 [Trichonephila clavata]